MNNFLALALVGAAVAVVSCRKRIRKCVACCCAGNMCNGAEHGAENSSCCMKEDADIVQQRYERAKESVLEHYNKLKQDVMMGYEKAKEDIMDVAAEVKHEVAGGYADVTDRTDNGVPRS